MGTGAGGRAGEGAGLARVRGIRGAERPAWVAEWAGALPRASRGEHREREKAGVSPGQPGGGRW